MNSIKSFLQKNILYGGSLLVVVIIGAYLSLHRMFVFDFWRDDWGQLWAAVYDPYLLAHVWPAVRLHPISAYEELYLVKIFGLNPLGWQIFGFILRIIDALCVAFLMYGISKSKKAAWFVGALFAVSMGGLETVTWPSVHTSAMVIPIICFGIYFWILSERESSWKKALLAIGFVFISIFADPGRAILLIGLFVLWDLCSLIQSFSKRKAIDVGVRIFFLVVIFLLLRPFMAASGLPIEATFINSYQQILKDKSIIYNAVYSLGNLMFGWFTPLIDVGSIGAREMPGWYGGLMLILITIFFALLFLIKKNNYIKIVFFFCVWIIVFYLPNWLFEKELVVGGTHRYLAISAVGLACILGFIFSQMKSKWGVLFLGITIFLNIQSSNRILFQESTFRSITAVGPLWQKINADVPANETDSIFMYSGTDYLRGVALDWSSSIPFGILRKVKNIDDFPIATGDPILIEKLICEGNILRPSIGKWSIQKNKIPLSHVHAWDLSNGVLTDISKEKRQEIAKTLPCSNP